jgi:hypothetical protein
MDVNFSKSDCCGEGAIKASDRQKSGAKFDGNDPEIVGQMMDPKPSEYLDGGTKALLSPKKPRTSSGRTIRAGR